MTFDEVKATLDVLSQWTPPDGIYYVLGYAPFSRESGLVISFGCEPGFNDSGETWDLTINQVPTLESLKFSETALIAKLKFLPGLGITGIPYMVTAPAPDVQSGEGA